MREQPITFESRTIASGKVRVNAETGVEIYEAGGWFVDWPTNLSVVLPTWTEELASYTEARRFAVEKVREIRRQREAAHVEALAL